MTDIIIRNATLLDGTGSPGIRADVAVENGLIAEVSENGIDRSAATEINAEGLHLSPGLIDTHAHDDGAFFRHPGMEFKLAQGVTTVVSGNCGFSAVPADPEQDSVTASGGILAGLEGSFTDLSGYFAAALERQPAINNMMLVGHNTVRSIVMGMERRSPTPDELTRMKDHVALALEQGACGFSTGLIYRPGRWSETEEVIELAAQARQHDALYTTHMRNEGDRLLEAVDETLTIGREADVHAHISHHKAAGVGNWGKIRSSLAKVDEALAAGQRVTLDVYPYTAGSGRMIEYFNLDNVNRELAEVIRIASCPAFREYEGRMAKDIASDEGRDVTEVIHSILTAPKGDRTICIHFIIDEADVETNLAYRDMMVGSDGIPDLRGKPHPRLFGTFPKVLGHYVRERGVLTLPEAIRRMTSLPARVFGMERRGQVKSGYWADLLLFDAAHVVDRATYDQPQSEPAGIHTVIVNGQVAYQNPASEQPGHHTGVGSGKMLRYRRTAFGDD